jgi:2,3-bisphosphoglycerate-independent phosphoglycerate mutase
MPDHPTPISKRTHTSDSVPYMLYDSTAEQHNTWNYNEEEAAKSGNNIPEGYKLMDKFLQV